MGNAPQSGDLITSADFAAVAKVSTSTVERWRFDGHGPAPVRLGYRTVRYRRADVESFCGLGDPPGK